MRRMLKHQRTAFNYALKQTHPALFMEMRLGKCLVAIRRIKLYTPVFPSLGLRVLIVAPSSALESWNRELKYEGESHVFFLTGNKETRGKTLLDNGFGSAHPKNCWYLINKEGFLALPQIASRHYVEWDAVVLDESFIRNPRAKVTQFYTHHFRSVPHRWLLTGTPNPESDLEFFPQLQWLDNMAFGYKNFWDFRAKEYVPDARGYKWIPRAGVQQKIRDYVKRRCFVMQRRDVGVEPVKQHVQRTIEFPPEIRKAYDILEKDFELDGVQTIWATTRYIWLRRLTGGFSVVKEEGKEKEDIKKLEWDGKFDVLLELLTGELKNASVVVWFHFNAELQYAHELLSINKVLHRILWGEQELDERRKIENEFKDGKVRVLLIQQAVAEFGMDLSAADTAIYFSQNPAALSSQQTHDRIVNLSKDSILLYIYLIVKNTVDEDIYNALIEKRWSSQLSLNDALKESINARKSS